MGSCRHEKQSCCICGTFHCRPLQEKKLFDWINVPVCIFLEREKLFQRKAPSTAMLTFRLSMEDASFALTPLHFVIPYLMLRKIIA